MNVNQRAICQNKYFIYLFRRHSLISGVPQLDSDPCNGGHSRGPRRDILFCGGIALNYSNLMNRDLKHVLVCDRNRECFLVCVWTENYNVLTLYCEDNTGLLTSELWYLLRLQRWWGDKEVLLCLLGVNLWTVGSKTESFQPPTTSRANTVNSHLTFCWHQVPVLRNKK